ELIERLEQRGELRLQIRGGVGQGERLAGHAGNSVSGTAVGQAVPIDKGPMGLFPFGTMVLHREWHESDPSVQGASTGRTAIWSRTYTMSGSASPPCSGVT